MALDYANERYVRIYVRDTVTVKLLSWHARALLWELLRKADRAGVIDVGQDGNAGIAALVSAPTEVIDRAMPELLARGVIRGGDGCFVFPNFIAAQETPQSDKLRKQKSRELKRDTALNGVTVRDVGSQNVTKGHAESHDVTLSLASLSLAEPSQTDIMPASPPSRRKPAKQLPAGWAPSDEHAVIATERDVDLDAEAEKFRDWARSNAKPKADWEATFRNWLRNAKPRQRAWAAKPRDIRFGSAPPSDFAGIAPGEYEL